MKKKHPKLTTWILAIASVIGPIAFEIANIITGDWFVDGKFNLSGKIVAIIFLIIYIAIVVWMTMVELRAKSDVEDYTKKIDSLEKTNSILKFTLTNLDNMVGYANENVLKQAEYLQKQNDTRIRELDIVRFATSACTVCYDIFSKLWGKEYITVNIYQKYQKADKKFYTKMIAHEGHITQPKYFGIERMLRNQKNNYFCEKIMLDENPSYIILLSPEDVARQFNIPLANCKYKQYIAIPIIDASRKLRLLVEVNVINEPILGTNEADVLKKIEEYFLWIKDYLLLTMGIENYAKIVEEKIKGEGDEV